MLDYAPDRTKLPGAIDLAHGVIQAQYLNRANSVSAAIDRRIDPHGRGEPTCYAQQLLLPRGAPDALDDRDALCARFEAQMMPAQIDLMSVTTFRHDHETPHHLAWRRTLAFIAEKCVDAFGVAGIAVQHVPALASRDGKPHVHFLAFARILRGSTFGAFSPLVKPGAKALVGKEWAAWLKAHP